MTAWIDCCLTTHNVCSISEPALLPTRVIDIGDQAEQPIRLFLGQGSKDRYIALSHCWGNQRIITTTLATLEDRKRNIPWESLSKTFQDAVIIARKLRVRFIWIDSLCIIQDDNEDWEVESGKMGLIYENSYLTISATASAHGNHVGCLGLRPSEKISSNEIKRHREDGQPITVRVRKVPWDRHEAITFTTLRSTSCEPLLVRAWAFQERLLSTRIIHYTSSELIWECKTVLACECTRIRPNIQNSIADMISHNFVRQLAPGPDLPIQWYRIVTQYSERGLTYECDIFPALSGIAKKLQAYGMGAYLAGIWSSDLIRGMLWFPDPEPTCRRAENVPTWSWASIVGKVSWEWFVVMAHGEFLESLVIHARVLEAECVPAGLDPTGRILRGKVRLEGAVADAVLEYTYSETQNPRHITYHLIRGTQKRELYVDVPIHTGEERIAPGETLYCLHMLSAPRRDSCLVLRTARTIDSAYQRIGLMRSFDLAEFQGTSEEWFAGTQERVMDIV